MKERLLAKILSTNYWQSIVDNELDSDMVDINTLSYDSLLQLYTELLKRGI